MTRNFYVVLIESRQRIWRATWWLAAAVTIALSLPWQPLSAQTTGGSKIASDLLKVIAKPSDPKTNWYKQVSGRPLVKVLIVSASGEPDLATLRRSVLDAGGSVYYRYTSVSALSALLPLDKVTAIASLPDVQSISPNRITSRTQSELELITGAAAVRGASGIVRLDGSGIGIAMLDSGIAWNHASMNDAAGRSRVVRAVNVQKVGDTAVGGKDWTVGIDVAALLTPGSAASITLEQSIAADALATPDSYGHGTHVASIAAGSGGFRSIDATGVAPNAKLIDVQVLDANGYGQVGDVLAGIDWVIANAKQIQHPRHQPEPVRPTRPRAT